MGCVRWEGNLGGGNQPIMNCTCMTDVFLAYLNEGTRLNGIRSLGEDIALVRDSVWSKVTIWALGIGGARHTGNPRDLTGLDVTGGACGLIGCNAMNLTNIRYLVSPVVHGRRQHGARVPSIIYPLPVAEFRSACP